MSESENHIRTLLLMDLQAAELRVTLCNLAGGLDESADTLQVLKDCFAKKKHRDDSQKDLRNFGHLQFGCWNMNRLPFGP